jgi:hypothetical protein
VISHHVYVLTWYLQAESTRISRSAEATWVSLAQQHGAEAISSRPACHQGLISQGRVYYTGTVPASLSIKLSQLAMIAHAGEGGRICGGCLVMDGARA